MAKPKKEIPLTDVKGLTTLIKEGYTQEQMAAYYGVDQATISRRFQEIADALQYLAGGIQEAFKPVRKAMENLANNPEFMTALGEAVKESKKNVELDEWTFFDKRAIFDLDEHKADIRLPDDEYRLETSFGEEISFTVNKHYPLSNTFELTADIPKNAGCLYVFRRKRGK